MPTDSSPFIIPTAAENIDVYDANRNAFVQAIVSSTQSVETLRNVSLVPTNLDGKARLVSHLPAPYAIVDSTSDTFEITVDGGTEVAIDITAPTGTATTVTAQSIANDINSATDNPGITASVVSYENSDYILLETNSSGTDSVIEIGDGTANDILGFNEDSYGSEQYDYDQKKPTIITKLNEAISDLKDLTDSMKTNEIRYHHNFAIRKKFELDS